MTDDERREWLAGLRPYDRVGLSMQQGEYLRGCCLLAKHKPYDWRPDDPYWDVSPDAVEQLVEIDEMRVWESELEPLPFPGMTGLAYVGSPAKPQRRRSRPKAPTASA